MGPDLRRHDQLGGTRKPYPTRLPLHLGGFVLIHTRVSWASNPHGNSPYEQPAKDGSLTALLGLWDLETHFPFDMAVIEAQPHLSYMCRAHLMTIVVWTRHM